MYLGIMSPKSARPPIHDEFTFDLGEDVTPDEAHAFTRFLNRPEGQAFLWRIAESLVQLRREKKRRRYQAAAGPVVDPTMLPFVLTVEEVAGLLRTTVDGVYARVERGQLTGVEGLLREGRKVLFHRDKLVRSLERPADGRARRGGRR